MLRLLNFRANRCKVYVHIFESFQIRLITPGCQWTQGVYTYDGSVVPPPLAIMPCAPNNDTIQVYFHSDLSEEGAGFQMNFTIAGILQTEFVLIIIDVVRIIKAVGDNENVDSH